MDHNCLNGFCTALNVASTYLCLYQKNEEKLSEHRHYIVDCIGIMRGIV